MTLFQESSVPQEYTAFNPDYARDFPTPDTLEARQKFMESIEQKLRGAYGESALAEPAERTQRSLEKRKDDLAYGSRKRIIPMRRLKISDVVLRAMILYQHSPLANGL